MPASLKTRKPIDKLTIADLRKFRIWEYAIDEESEPDRDETWIRPIKSEMIPSNAYSQIVAASFTSASGGQFKGFMVVTTAASPVGIQPGAIIGSFGYRCLPMMSRALAIKNGLQWNNHIRDQILSSLSLDERELFPLRYELLAKVGGEDSIRTGIVG